MSQKRIPIGLLIAVLVGILPAFSLAAPTLRASWLAQEGTNLLKNPGFEADWGMESNHRATIFSEGGGSYEKEIGNIFTPPGWSTWFLHNAGTWDQPEVQDAWDYVDIRRVHSGIKAIKLFTFYRKHDAGFYQTVSGLEPGATVQFSAYAAAWTCEEDNDDATSCGEPWAMVFKVGIEPNGALNPYSPNIVWSAKQNSPDQHRLIGPITAQVGPEGKVTVFLRSKAKWAYKHMDAYWDDASLVVTSPGKTPTSTPLPPPPTATYGPSPTPRATPTPRPDGATVHIVESGDTLFGIALMYNVPTDQIRELNAGSLGPNDLLSIGQELVISLPSETPVPTPLPAPPTPTPAPVLPTPVGASICVLAFHDRNGDRFQNPDIEELLPNAEFTVADASGVVAQYISDGISEPYCFTALTPGGYRVIQNPPPGYEPSGLPEQNVALAEGTSFDFQFGNVRSEEAVSPEETAEPTQTNEDDNEPSGGSTFSRIFATVAKIAGVLVLVLAAGVAVLFVLNQRRR